MTRPAAILHHSDPMLHLRAEPVTSFGPALAAVVDTMRATLLHSSRPGVGLAAPQIGVSLRVVIVRANQSSPLIVLVNPVITDASGKFTAREGCLSVPEFDVAVERPTRIHVSAQRVDGTPFGMRPRDFLARVILHECDHIDGVTLAEKVGRRWERRETLEDRVAKYVTARADDVAHLRHAALAARCGACEVRQQSGFRLPTDEHSCSLGTAHAPHSVARPEAVYARIEGKPLSPASAAGLAAMLSTGGK